MVPVVSLFAAFSSLPVLASGFLKLILLFRQISQDLPTLGSQSQSARCGHRGAFCHKFFSGHADCTGGLVCVRDPAGAPGGRVAGSAECCTSSSLAEQL